MMTATEASTKRTINSAIDAVLTPSAAFDASLLPQQQQHTTTSDFTKVSGFDFDKTPVSLNALMDAYLTTGYQATHLSLAIKEIRRMIDWRLSHEPIEADELDEFKSHEARERIKCKIFLGYTSNLVSSGLRDIFRYLIQHEKVHCVVTTAGGVEEDIIKCLGPTLLGSFTLPGTELRKQGLNRIGNLIVPNDNYCKFEQWVMPILDAMLDEQKKEGIIWTPSKIIHRLGKEINNPESFCYWAYKNNIPIYSPAITDGSFGDMVYFHSYRNPGLIIDIAGDIRCMNNEAVHERKTGVIILGGGVVKHHICNANLMRNGSDFAVYVNTAQEFDGSDAGATPDEAVSWGKIRIGAKPVKIHADATLIFPLLVSQTFARSKE